MRNEVWNVFDLNSQKTTGFIANDMSYNEAIKIAKTLDGDKITIFRTVI